MTALPYERGEILRSTSDDLTKIRVAWAELRCRHTAGEPVWNFTGLERSLPAALPPIDDELAAALAADRVRELALEHLGGDPETDDVVVSNRLTAALVAANVALVRPGQTVVGISPSYSHPAVRRAAALRGARFVDTRSVEELRRALASETDVALVVLTRLAVTYELLPAEALAAAVEAAHESGVRVLVDDAGGARVGPAVFDQPQTLELGADIGATGLDKYGTLGPRLGLLAGRRELVEEIRARAYELGLEARPLLFPSVVASLEAYRPERVRALVESTREVASALRARLGDLVHETPVTAQLRGEDVLARVGGRSPVVPYEATAALAMLLLVEHGILTVHFAAVPPGTSALLFKFVPPELLERFGGAERFADAVAGCLDRLADVVGDERALRRLLLGTQPPDALTGADARPARPSRL